MPPDQGMRGFVMATALFTSFFFALGAWAPVGLFLRWLLAG
jgi:hypothetical protein